MDELACMSTISMTRRINIMIPAPQFFLDMFYPADPRDVHGTRSVIVDITIGGQTMSPFVHECLPAHVAARDPVRSQTITPPYLKDMRDLKGCELGDRLPGVSPFLDVDPEQRIQAVQEADMQAMSDRMDRREEWMATQQLVKDLVPCRGEGTNFDLNIRFPADHKITASAAWSTPTGDAPLTDLGTAQDKIASKGFTATDAIYGKTAWANFRKNAGVKEMLDIRNINGNVLQAALITTGAVFRGEMNGLRLWTYGASFIDDTTKLLTPMIPDEMVLVGSTGGDGRRHYALIEDLDAPGGRVAVRRFSKTWRVPNPSAQYTLVQSAPLPVMHTPEAWARIDTTP